MEPAVESEQPAAVKIETNAASPAEASAAAPVDASAAAPEKRMQGKKEKKEKLEELKVPKGTKDYTPFQMSIREEVFRKVKECFRRHGAVTIETPVFELKSTLTGKYGEDSKLIYDLADQGGEHCSLRYDLTVPFARYIAMNKIKAIKAFRIARVYRRDNPVMTKGRFREFYQCDFDVAGEYDAMIPDAECLALCCEILDSVRVGSYKLKLNHRKLLDGVFSLAGVPEEKFRTICSAVDKLDKLPWAEVRQEMVETKGLDGEVADRIGRMVQLGGHPRDLLQRITDEQLLAKAAGLPEGVKQESNPMVAEALADLRLLFSYLESFGVIDKCSFELSLARGLDYYTGMIFEAQLTAGKTELGSICAGGRYDRLVGIYSGKDVPSVGFSVGIERVFAILEDQVTKELKSNPHAFRESETQVMVVSIAKDMVNDRMRLASELWAAGIKAELVYKTNPKLPVQLNHAEKEKIPLALIFGPDEIASGTLKLKSLVKDEKDPTKQITIQRANVVEEVRKALAELNAPQAPAAAAAGTVLAAGSSQ